jgi:hypothetical protein
MRWRGGEMRQPARIVHPTRRPRVLSALHLDPFALTSPPAPTLLQPCAQICAARVSARSAGACVPASVHGSWLTRRSAGSSSPAPHAPRHRLAAAPWPPPAAHMADAAAGAAALPHGLPRAASVKSLDAYLPARIRDSPALCAAARTPRTLMAMGGAAAGSLPAMPDLDLGMGAVAPPAPAEVALPGMLGGAGGGGGDAPSSPGRQRASATPTITYAYGSTTGCAGMEVLDGGMSTASRRGRPPSATSTYPAVLSSPQGK